MKRKWLIRSLVAISVGLEIYMLYHLPSVLLALTYLAGRSDCSFKNTIGLADWKIQYADSERRIKETSHLVRRDDKLELWATPQGEFWMPAGGSISEFGVIAEQELRVYGSGLSGVQPGDVVIDCGADIGTFTRLVLEMGASKVIAVEPALGNQASLQRTFYREIAEGRVKLYPKGVWNKDDFMTLYNPGIYGSVVTQITSGAGERIPLTTIDKLVAELQLDRVDFIKMDIEGSEKQALEGARQTLVQFKPRLAISCEHFQSDGKEIPRLVLAMVPAYAQECGPCAYFDGRICPYVLYFH
jgi:FkbM family methyltransferase